MTPIIEAKGLHFAYRNTTRKILQGFNFEVQRGELLAIQGPSGSGKSTLLYLLGGFLEPQSGEITIDGQNVFEMRGQKQAIFRNQTIGFIFQQFYLLPKSNVLENIMVPSLYPSEIVRKDKKKFREKAKKIATDLGLGEHLHHLPSQLSGGQQQRVAIARALLNEPDIILADEPTGNLDSKTATEIFQLLKDIAASGKSVVIITHDDEIARNCDRIVKIRDGENDGIVVNREPSPVKHKTDPDKFKVRKTSFFANVINLLPMAFRNLSHNKGRSALTMIGIVIGVASVLSMMTVGNFTKEKILASYETLGARKVLIRGWENHALRATDVVVNRFTEFDWKKDIEPFRKYFGNIELASPLLVNWNRTPISFAGNRLDKDVRVFGISHQYLKISDLELLMGKGINRFHVENKTRVCIIGFQIAKKLFSQVPPIGQLLNVEVQDGSPYSCRIVGVIDNYQTNDSWQDPAYKVLVPYTFFLASNPAWYARIQRVALKISADSNIEAFTKAAPRYFQNKYGKSGQFFANSDAILLAQINQFLSLFKILLAAIASLALLVGGVGITNMMLASISEQLREIGIRKAHGATDNSIRMQYLIESICLCFVAGILGILIGFGLSQAVVYFSAQFIDKITFEWVINYPAIFISVGSIFLVGLLSGLIPAVKAENLQVVDALRSD